MIRPLRLCEAQQADIFLNFFPDLLVTTISFNNSYFPERWGSMVQEHFSCNHLELYRHSKVNGKNCTLKDRC